MSDGMEELRVESGTHGSRRLLQHKFSVQSRGYGGGGKLPVFDVQLIVGGISLIENATKSNKIKRWDSRARL